MSNETITSKSSASSGIQVTSRYDTEPGDITKAPIVVIERCTNSTKADRAVSKCEKRKADISIETLKNSRDLNCSKETLRSGLVHTPVREQIEIAEEAPTPVENLNFEIYEDTVSK